MNPSPDPAPPPFRAPAWCRNPHLQTLWPVVAGRHPSPPLRRQRLELPDGDFLDLDWLRDAPADPAAPVLLILHGLQGSSRSHYARRLLALAARRGWRAAVMHFRGTSGEPNRLARSYHSGETADLGHVLGHLADACPRAPRVVIGVSLGGNVLLKWLGEAGGRAPVDAALAVSVPLDLAASSRHLDRGLARLYRDRLLRDLKGALRAKAARRPLPIDLAAALRARTFTEFDARVTAPLHGFAGAEDYYRRCSAVRFLAGIRAPTWILQARDDPFLPAAALPDPGALPSCVQLALSAHGGHVGFVAGRPWAPRYWLEVVAGVLLASVSRRKTAA